MIWFTGWKLASDGSYFCNGLIGSGSLNADWLKPRVEKCIKLIVRALGINVSSDDMSVDDRINGVLQEKS